MENNKIKSLNNLVKQLSKLSKYTKIVLCHGVFDLLHIGHIKYFQEAKSFGDLLVVTITADKHISKKRVFSFDEDVRAKQLASNEVIDNVAIIDEASAVTAIELLKPDYYVKGKEYENDLSI